MMAAAHDKVKDFKGFPDDDRIINREVICEKDRDIVTLTDKNKGIRIAYEKHADTVYRVCFLFMKQNKHDLEDAVQKTFVKLIEHSKDFNSEEHEKAWLIVTASNICRDMLKSWWNKKVVVDSELIINKESGSGTDETLKCLLALPDKYKASLYMHYYENYSCADIAELMHKSQGTIWNYLHVGRKLLKSYLDGKNI